MRGGMEAGLAFGQVTQTHTPHTGSVAHTPPLGVWPAGGAYLSPLMLAQMRGTISPAAMTLPPGRQFKVMSGPTATDAAPSKGAEADHEAVLGRT